MRIAALSIVTIGLALTLVSPDAAAEIIYKSIGNDGMVTYSRAPVPGAKQTTTIDVMTLSPEQRRATLLLDLKAADRALADAQAKKQEALRRADKELRAAHVGLGRAESALAAGRKPLAADWIGKLGGGARLRESYFQRLAALEDRVNRDKARLDKAYEERNALE